MPAPELAERSQEGHRSQAQRSHRAGHLIWLKDLLIEAPANNDNKASL
jgi:hypothetical protein